MCCLEQNQINYFHSFQGQTLRLYNKCSNSGESVSLKVVKIMQGLNSFPPKNRFQIPPLPQLIWMFIKPHSIMLALFDILFSSGNLKNENVSFTKLTHYDILSLSLVDQSVTTLEVINNEINNLNILTQNQFVIHSLNCY